VRTFVASSFSSASLADEALFQDFQRFLGALALVMSGTDGDVRPGFSIFPPTKRYDYRGVDPVMRASWARLRISPCQTCRCDVGHLLEEFVGMMAGVEDA